MASSDSDPGTPAWRRLPTALRRVFAGSPGVTALAAVQLIAVAGLGIDAYVHLDLASTYAEAQAAINEGVMFRVEAVAAILAALVVIVSARRLAFALAFAVAASALALMLISRYVDIGAIGPFPDPYDPVWFPEKLWAAYGEAAAALAALAGMALFGVRVVRRSGRTAPGSAGHRHGEIQGRR